MIEEMALTMLQDPENTLLKYNNWRANDNLLRLQRFTPFTQLIDFLENTRIKRFCNKFDRNEILMLMYGLRKHAPFSENIRFPEEYWVNLSVGSIAEALDRLQSALDLPDPQMPVHISGTDFNHWKQLFDASMAEIRSFVHCTSIQDLAAVGVYNRMTFEKHVGLEWGD